MKLSATVSSNCKNIRGRPSDTKIWPVTKISTPTPHPTSLHLGYKWKNRHKTGHLNHSQEAVLQVTWRRMNGIGYCAQVYPSHAIGAIKDITCKSPGLSHSSSNYHGCYNVTLTLLVSDFVLASRWLVSTLNFTKPKTDPSKFLIPC